MKILKLGRAAMWKIDLHEYMKKLGNVSTQILHYNGKLITNHYKTNALPHHTLNIKLAFSTRYNYEALTLVTIQTNISSCLGQKIQLQ
jgi:hypothetical protein